MKVVCDRASLLDAVVLVSGVAASRTPRPQLTCVKLDALTESDAPELALSATDAEISLRLRIGQVEIGEAGSALVPADKLLQIVRAEENDATLTLESDGHACHVRGTDAHFQLHGFDPVDFPPVPGPGDGSPSDARFVIPAGDLAGLISRSIFATSRENTRYAINGVLIKSDGKKLEFVATDGRRLALARTALAQPAAHAGPKSCIVPTKALNMLIKLVDDPDEPVTVTFGENQILFIIGEPVDDARAVLASRLVEGTFPPYDDVIPKDQDIRITVDRDVLASAVRRAALLTNEESRGVRMAFNKSAKTLQLSSRAPEMGEARVTVDVVEHDGNDIEIGFNPAFVTDALKVIHDPAVQIELKAPSKPGVVRSGSDFLYVVMPLNLT